MFNLDQAIEGWRQQMVRGGVDHPEALDELESHLRDEMETQVRGGANAQVAFNAAVERIGHAANLKHEFAKSFAAIDRLKHAAFTLAGIPNCNLVTTMNTSRIEPGWATYLKATTFLLPAIFLAIVAAVFVVPKLQQMCSDAGLPAAMAGTFWSLAYSSIQVMLLLSDHGWFIAGASLLLIGLLEWRFAGWPRYRRAAIGCGAFVLNTIVLLAFFMMFLAAILAAPGLQK